MQKDRKVESLGLYIKTDYYETRGPRRLMIIVIFVAVSWGVGRWTARVLRVLIRFEALSIIALVGVVYCSVLGAFQVFVCLAVLTAVVGLTTWVTGN